MLNKISHLFAAIVGRQCGGKREFEGNPASIGVRPLASNIQELD